MNFEPFLLFGDMAARAAAKTSHDHYGATTLHPVGLACLAILGAWLLFANRKSALLPWMIMACFIPSAQRIVIAGADFTFLRIMVIVGLTRLVSRGDLFSLRINRIDIVYFSWTVISAVVYVVQQQEIRAVVYSCGVVMDMLGAYIITRSLISNIDYLVNFCKILALLSIVVCVFFLVERSTGRNLFSTFGGVPEITVVREDRMRCQGAFSHPIVAGVFWAVVGAVSAGAAFGARNRILFILGTISCVIIVATTASSTPLLGILAAITFWICWPIRSMMKYAFIATPFGLTALHLVMKAPVWHLVSRVSAVGGSTGHHRYILIDGAINHFNEWWLVGTTWTGHWSDAFQTWDITNQYILEGVRGGIWRLGLFALLIFLVAMQIGRAMETARKRSDKFIVYGVGASLFVHCVCFIGVSYFGQIEYLWYMTIGIGGSFANPRFFESEQIARPTKPQRKIMTQNHQLEATGRLI